MTLRHKIAFVNHKALPWLELRLYRGLNYGLSYGRRKKEYAGLNGQVCHFNGCGSGFRALVAQSAAGAVECLLQILHGEDAEDVYKRQIYGSGEADNDALFRQNKFKAVKEALLKSAFADADFMQSSYVAGQNVTKPSQLRGLFSPAVNDGWDGMVLPPAALTDAGVVFSFTPAAGTPAAKSTYHFTVPYLTLQHCFTNEASQAITTAFPSVFVKPK